MANEYADLAIDTQILNGIEDEALQAITDDKWILAKRRLRARLRPIMDAYMQFHAVAETTFYDTLAGLTTADLYEELRTMVALEALVQYYAERRGLPGTGTTAEIKRDQYLEDLMLHAKSFGRMLDWAYENSELTLPTDRTQDGGAVLWIA